MDEIGTILPTVFRKQIRREEPHLLEILVPLWPRIAGKSIAQHSRPSYFAAGVLTLATDSSTWTTQLRLMGDEIRSQINGFMCQPIVKKLRVRTVVQPDLFSPLRPPKGIASSAQPRMAQAMDTTSIADPAIATALASSYAKYFNRPRRKPSA